MHKSIQRVLVVTSEFPPMPGGIGNHAYNLCVYLMQHGYNVHVLTNKRASNQSDFDMFVSANLDLTITALERKSNSLATYINRIKEYKKALKIQPDIIVYSGKFSIWLAALGWHNAKSIAVVHGSEIRQAGLKKIWFERGLSKLQRIISVSSFTQAQLVEAFPTLDSHKCLVINNGFDLPEYPSVQHIPQGGECSLITVGGMHRRKGQHNIIASLPTLKKYFPGVTYTIAGLPETMNSLVELAQSLGVSDIVHFVPNPSRDELVQLLQKSHVFAMLSENLPNGDIEGFGIAILEGMSLGLPAIGSKNSGIRDAIDHKKAGWLIDDIHNPVEIATALQDIISNYQVYSSNAKVWSNRFKWSNVISQYLKVIEEL